MKHPKNTLERHMTASRLSVLTDTTLPVEMVTIIEDVGFLESIPLLGFLFI